jgi:GNAT superfamily N-acetyltransferase
MFFKICEEIKSTYIQENKINYKKGKFNLSEITHDINGLIFMFLDSYYFENINDFKFVKSKINNDEDYFYIVNCENKFSKENIRLKLDKKEIEIAQKYFETKDTNTFRQIALNKSTESGVFFMARKEIIDIFNEMPLKSYTNITDSFEDEFGIYNDYPNKKFQIETPYVEVPSLASVNLNDKMIKTINKLKEQDLYSLIFTNEPITQILNLKNKKEIDINIIDINDNCSEISGLSKFSNDFQIKSDLRDFYGLKYFTSNNDKNFKLLVAHNEYEIAGLAALVPPYDDNIRKDSCVFLSYVEVAEHFYGLGLGNKLAESAIEYAKENKMVLFRTSPSKLGEKYIKDKITQQGIDSKVPVVSEPERNIINRILSIMKDKNNEEIFNFTYGALTYIRENYTEKELNNGLINTKIIAHLMKDKKGLKNGI